MKKVIQWIDKWAEELILSVLLGAMACVMFVQICLRFLTSHTMIWPEEFSRYCFIYIAFFCIPLCIKRATMLKVDILVGMLPGKIKDVVLYIGEIVTFLVFVYLFYFSFAVLKNAIDRPSYSQTMGFNTVIIYGMPVFAFGLSVIRGLQHLIKLAKTTFGKGEQKQELSEAEQYIKEAQEDLERAK